MKPRHLSIAALALVIGACGYDSDAGGFHTCNLTENSPSSWEYYQLYVYHEEPRYCPVSILGPYDRVFAAGTVLDQGARNFLTSQLSVYNQENQQVGIDQQYFDYDQNQDWIVQHGLSYPAATSTIFELSPDGMVYALGSGFGDPSASLTITYVQP